MQRVVDKYVRFMPIAYTIAAMSKDPSTKVGSLILGPNFEIRSSGWNGAPQGSRADVDERINDRAEKLMWMSHAESNAIAQAARVGTPLAGCTILVTHSPCMACAKLIVQAGILRVVNPIGDKEFRDRWAADIHRTRALFIECGIEHIEIDPIESKA